MQGPAQQIKEHQGKFTTVREEMFNITVVTPATKLQAVLSVANTEHSISNNL